MGTDMKRFPTSAHISSWAGLCPGNNEGAGKRKSGKTRKGNTLLRSTLVVCAHSAVNCKNSYFHAQFKRISAHRGGKTCICCHGGTPHIVYNFSSNSKSFCEKNSGTCLLKAPVVISAQLYCFIYSPR
nr:IS110 family transposase [Acetivibrio ethanolgignens]